MNLRTNLLRGGSLLKSVTRQSIGLFYPSVCLGCEAQDQILCLRCWRALLRPPRRERFAGLELTYCREYDQLAQNLLRGYKIGNRTALAPFLGKLLERALAAAPQCSIITLPSTRTSWRQRGFHPIRLALQQVAIKPPERLRYRRQPQDQSGLSSAQRRRNLVGSLELTGPAAGQRLWLVDDIITSGATVLEVRRAAAEAGAELVGATALFRSCSQ